MIYSRASARTVGRGLTGVVAIMAIAACSSGPKGFGGSGGPGELPGDDEGTDGEAMPSEDASSDAGAATDTGTTNEAGTRPEAGPGTDGALVDAVAVDGVAVDTGSGPAEAGSDAESFTGPWNPVSNGVTTKDTGGGDNIVIVYGGYTATMVDSQGWVTQLTSVRLGPLGVGHMYAVQGPEDPDYSAREIGNSELAAALATQATPSTYVIILAHSSGGFVADELFTFVDSSVMSKIAYFNLDGGSWALTDTMVTTMRGVYFCGAHDSVAGYSENWSSDQSLYSDFPGSNLFLVDADGSGCDVGAGWCLHDTLITTRPHDPTTYDLDDDYTDFTGPGRQVVTSYIDQAVTDGAL
jgi:hypothetical protein